MRADFQTTSMVRLLNSTSLPSLYGTLLDFSMFRVGAITASEELIFPPPRSQHFREVVSQTALMAWARTLRLILSTASLWTQAILCFTFLMNMDAASAPLILQLHLCRQLQETALLQVSMVLASVRVLTPLWAWHRLQLGCCTRRNTRLVASVRSRASPAPRLTTASPAHPSSALLAPTALSLPSI